MRPFMMLYLWLLVPIVFFAVMLYSAVRLGKDKRGRAVNKAGGTIGLSGMRKGRGGGVQ